MRPFVVACAIVVAGFGPVRADFYHTRAGPHPSHLPWGPTPTAAQGCRALCLAHARSAGPQALQTDRYGEARARMVEEQIRGRGVTDTATLAAMRKVPRHLFVPEAWRDAAYDDSPLPIGQGQTISQPFIVAHMTAALELNKKKKVLEIGTGSGYQAAVLAEIAGEVYTIEIVSQLATRADQLLKQLRYPNVRVRYGDGYLGWPDRAPFDAIIVTAAPDHVPKPLVDQLAVGGRMIIPVGTAFQEMVLITKTPQGVVEKRTMPVRFVPLTRKPRL